MRFKLFKKFHHNKFLYGYADHSIYGLSNEFISSMKLALNLNCSYYEKHVCLDIKKKPIDYISSVHFSDLDKIINKITFKKPININFNLKNKNTFSVEEKKYADEMHKKAFTKYKLKKNSMIGVKDLVFLRSKEKGGFKRLDMYKQNLLVKKDLKPNQFLKKSYVN